MTKQVTKIVGIWDEHFPENINKKPFLQWVKQFKPDIFILGGDMMDLACISHWHDESFKNVGFSNVNMRLRLECETYQGELDEYRDTMKKAHFVYITGNHEGWIQRYTEKYPQVGEITLSNMLSLQKRKIRLIEQGKYFKYGHLYFCHGDQWGSANPALQATVRGMRSIVMGHHHTYKVWSNYSAVESHEKFLGITVPCYCSLAPAYLKGKVNAWLNGFFWACIKKSGNFTCGVVPVSGKGNFISMNGKEYV